MVHVTKMEFIKNVLKFIIGCCVIYIIFKILINIPYDLINKKFWETWTLLYKICNPYKKNLIYCVIILFICPSLISIKYFHFKENTHTNFFFSCWKELFFLLTWIILFNLLGIIGLIVPSYMMWTMFVKTYCFQNISFLENTKKYNWYIKFKICYYFTRFGYLLCIIINIFTDINELYIYFFFTFLFIVWWWFVFVVFCPYMNYPLANKTLWILGSIFIYLSIIFTGSQSQIFTFFGICNICNELIDCVRTRDGFLEYLHKNERVYLYHFYIKILKHFSTNVFLIILKNVWIIEYWSYW